MKIIVFTLDEIYPKEAQIIALLLENGVDRIHIRKSSFNIAEGLLYEIPSKYYSKISVHYHYNLLKRFKGIGFHMSKKQQINDLDEINTVLKSSFNDLISNGIHSWNEIDNTNFDYQFISPVFDSISKKGYLKNSSLSHIPKEYIWRVQNIKVAKDFGYQGFNLGICMEFKTQLNILNKLNYLCQ